MSRRKIRDERRRPAREGRQPVWPGKGGEGPPHDLEVESVAVGPEDPDLLDSDLPGRPPIEVPAPPSADQRKRVETAAGAEDTVEGVRKEAMATAARRWLEQGLVTSAQARAIGCLIRDGEPGPEVLDGLAEAGILTRSQAAAVNRAQRSNGHVALPVAGRRLRRFSPDARSLGVLLAAVAFVGLVWAGLSLVTDALATPRHPAGVALLDAMRLLASVLALVGGRRMYRGMQNGKALALIGLVIYALASVLMAVRRLADPVVVVLLISWAVLYYVTAMSRFGPAQAPPGRPAPR